MHSCRPGQADVRPPEPGAGGLLSDIATGSRETPGPGGTACSRKLSAMSRHSQLRERGIRGAIKENPVAQMGGSRPGDRPALSSATDWPRP